MAEARPLLCPRCATDHPLTLSACPVCGAPLTYGGMPDEDEASGRHERARKVLPQYTEGPPVTVATGRNQAEADLIAGLLLEEGIPSLVRRSAGADVPEMLAAGARDVLVPASGAEAARQTLLQAEMHDHGPPPRPAPGRLLAGLLAGVASAGAVVWLVVELQG